MNTRTHLAVLSILFAITFSWTHPAGAGIFIGSAGNYGGVIDPGIDGNFDNSGLVQVQLKESGVLTGMLVWQGQQYPFKGRLSEDKTFEKMFVKKAVQDRIELLLSLTLSPETLSISGTLTEASTVASFVLTGAPPDPGLVVQLQPGTRISFIDPPDPSNEGEEEAPSPIVLGPPPPAAPIPGDGFSIVNIGKTASRSARIVGRLPDHDGAYSAGSPMRGAKYSVFSSLYKKKKAFGGQLFGQATVQNNGDPAPQFQSQLRWGKRQNADPEFYSGGIKKDIFADALPYPKVKRGALVPILPGGSEPTRVINARATFRRGNIKFENSTDRFFRVSLNISPFNCKVVGDNPYKVKIRVDAFSGRFAGSFIHPVLQTKTKFEGAFQSSILLTAGIGRGNFRPVTKNSIVPLNESLESGGVVVSVN